MTIGKMNPFSAAQAGAQGIQAIPGRTYQPVNAVTAAGSGSSGLLDRLNQMNNKFEGGQTASNQFTGKVNGQDNYAAKKLDYSA